MKIKLISWKDDLFWVSKEEFYSTQISWA